MVCSFIDYYAAIKMNELPKCFIWVNLKGMLAQKKKKTIEECSMQSSIIYIKFENRQSYFSWLRVVDTCGKNIKTCLRMGDTKFIKQVTCEERRRAMRTGKQYIGAFSFICHI